MLGSAQMVKMGVFVDDMLVAADQSADTIKAHSAKFTGNVHSMTVDVAIFMCSAFLNAISTAFPHVKDGQHAIVSVVDCIKLKFPHVGAFRRWSPCDLVFSRTLRAR